jgi:hypothetical protein
MEREKKRLDKYSKVDVNPGIGLKCLKGTLILSVVSSYRRLAMSMRL